MDIERLKRRITFLITEPEEGRTELSDWDYGYNAACEQILKIIERMEKGV